MTLPGFEHGQLSLKLSTNLEASLSLLGGLCPKSRPGEREVVSVMGNGRTANGFGRCSLHKNSLQVHHRLQTADSWAASVSAYVGLISAVQTLEQTRGKSKLYTTCLGD